MAQQDLAHPRYAGIFPVAPTPFTDDRRRSISTGKRRVLDCMIDQGVDGICILANYSEQFLLSDDERDRCCRGRASSTSPAGFR